MKKENNFRIEITHDCGVSSTEHCNNYNCAVAYIEKIEREYKHVKTALYDAKNRCIHFYNNLQD